MANKVSMMDDIDDSAYDMVEEELVEVEQEEETLDETTDEVQPDSTKEEVSQEEDTEEAAGEDQQEVSEEVQPNVESTDGLSAHDDKLARAMEGRLVAIMDERKKRQEAEEREKALKEELERIREANREPEYVPDFNLDPQGFMDTIRRQQEEMILQERLNTSMETAEAEYGKDVLEAAKVWGAEQHQKTGGMFTQQAFANRSPAKFLVAEYQKAMKIEEVLNNEDAYFEKLARARGWAPVQTTQAPVNNAAPKAKPVRKPSLAEVESTKGGGADEPPISMMDF